MHIYIYLAPTRPQQLKPNNSTGQKKEYGFRSEEMEALRLLLKDKGKDKNKKLNFNTIDLTETQPSPSQQAGAETKSLSRFPGNRNCATSKSNVH